MSGEKHDHCDHCGWPITRVKEKTHQRLFRIATDTMVSGLAATMVVLALKFGGILR